MELRDRSLLAVQGSTEREPVQNNRGRRRFRAYRNGVPEVPYEYQKRSYPWAQRVIAEAEARYGKPQPVCGNCGASMGSDGRRCPAAPYGRVTCGD